MALNAQISHTGANAAVDALAALLNTGFIRIYSGVQPANANTALSGNTLLATLRFSATAFPGATAGVATANAITQDSDAAATGTAAFMRCLKSDGTTVVLDGSVGTATADLIIATTSIVQHAIITCSSFTITLPEA